MYQHFFPLRKYLAYCFCLVESSVPEYASIASSAASLYSDVIFHRPLYSKSPIYKRRPRTSHFSALFYRVLFVQCGHSQQIIFHERIWPQPLMVLKAQRDKSLSFHFVRLRWNLKGNFTWSDLDNWWQNHHKQRPQAPCKYLFQFLIASLSNHFVISGHFLRTLCGFSILFLSLNFKSGSSKQRWRFSNSTPPAEITWSWHPQLGGAGLFDSDDEKHGALYSSLRCQSS